MASWDDVPHISAVEKKSLASSIRPHELEARSKGIPTLGAGAIYPVPESLYIVEPFNIPHKWPRAYGLDVGWNRTAAVWGAYDRESDTVYLYSEHYMGQAEAPIHADAIKARGSWIPGVIDPASLGSGQADGKQLFNLYLQQGLNLELADNSLEAGIQEQWLRMSSGRLKVFSHLRNWIQECRIYRRDKNGKPVKENDHALDATRYLLMSGLQRAITEPEYDEYEEHLQNTRSLSMSKGGSGRCTITGY